MGACIDTCVLTFPLFIILMSVYVVFSPELLNYLKEKKLLTLVVIFFLVYLNGELRRVLQERTI